MLSADTKLDRTLHFRVGALRGMVRSNDERFLVDFQRVFYHRITSDEVQNPDLCFDVAVDRSFNFSKRHSVVEADSGELVVVTAFYPSLFPALENPIVERAIEIHEPYCPLDGAFVTHGGKGLLIVGDYASGRHLLVKTLAARDATYYGDGIAILLMPRREALHVPKGIAVPRSSHPLTDFQRRDLSFRQRGRTAVRYVLPELRGELATDHGPGVDAILFPERQDVDEAEVVEMKRADALVRLMNHTFRSARHGVERFAYLADLVREVPAFSVRIKGLKRTTDRLFEKLRDVAPATVEALP